MRMVAVHFLILVLLLLAVPAIIGGLFGHMEKYGGNLIFRWISGQFLLWAGFQLICVPLILRQQSFTFLTELFGGYTAVLTLLALALEVKRRRKAGTLVFRMAGGAAGQKPGESAVLWALFGALLLFQLVQAVRLAYADTDDAYYVAVASVAENSDTMYQVLPYTGGIGGTELDSRHGLAPFPIWIAFLAKVSGVRTVTVAQVALPVVLIAMTYGIYYLFARELFPERRGQQALFLIFTEILVLFGNYSIYTVENFMIARSRQGKAALGNIVIPFLLLLLLLLLHKLQEKERIPVLLYLLFGIVMMTGCLCSTLGVLLMCMAVGVAGVLGAICYRRPWILPPLALTCMPCVVYAALYLFLDF